MSGCSLRALLSDRKSSRSTVNAGIELAAGAHEG
jgi:hypothetical protein